MEGVKVSNNKRIAKNTAFLYIRMLFITILSLYAARLLLCNLGVEDFGVYNVVGGVVTFMGFLTATMSSATQRYLSYYLGANDLMRLRQTFSLLVNVYLAFCLFALILLEIIGPLYISKYMTISADRIVAAQYVFQFSLLSFLCSTVVVPFKSAIIAYEKMHLFAYVGIIEAVLNLVSVILLSYFDYDKLILYGFLLFSSHLCVNIWVVYYCSGHLKGCRYSYYWDKKYFKEILSYSGWNLFGSTTGVMNIQGQAIVLNFFFGPVVNAAKAISDKVNGLISHFSSNFYMAVAPQIIKSYASGDINYMRMLVLNSSRYSFLLMFVISVPLFIVVKPLLELWLGEDKVSYEMLKFSQFTIIYSLVNVLEQPLTMSVRATGNIKKYQIYVGSFTLLFIPLCIIMFYLGIPSYYSMLLLSFVYFIALFIRIHIVSPILMITNVEYITKVLFPILSVISFDFIFLTIISMIKSLYVGVWIFNALIALLVTTLVCITIGINKSEKKIVNAYIKNRVKNFL